MHCVCCFPRQPMLGWVGKWQWPMQDSLLVPSLPAVLTDVTRDPVVWPAREVEGASSPALISLLMSPTIPYWEGSFSKKFLSGNTPRQLPRLQTNASASFPWEESQAGNYHRKELELIDFYLHSLHLFIQFLSNLFESTSIFHHLRKLSHSFATEIFLL